MNTHRSGFTLLEIMIAMMILAITIAAAGTALDQGERFNERITLENELTDKVNRVLNDLAMELRTCDAQPSHLNVGSTLISPSLNASTYSTDGYSDYTQLKIYQYRISSGIQWDAAAGVFGGQLESTCHRVVYDPIGGTLVKELWDSYTNPLNRTWKISLCDQISPIDATHSRGGFYIDQIGNTLAMELSVYTSYRAGYFGESIIKVADSQVLFLRTTLDSNLGSAAYNKSDAVFTGDNASNSSPTVLFGHLITYASVANTGEISIFVQPPIGQTLGGSTTITNGDTNDRGVTVTVNTYDATGAANAPVTMMEGTSVAVSPYSTGLTRTTRPDKNGNVTVTLYGNVTGSLTVTATATTTGGITTTATKTF